MVTDDQIKKAIADSPLINEDKDHWLEILPKLNESQRTRFHHCLVTKTDVASAKAAIKRALAIIDEAESEASDDIAKEKAQSMAKEELVKEIESKNPMMPKPEEVTSKELIEHRKEANVKLEDLRAELAQISQEAHGTPPPSVVKAPEKVAPGNKMPQA